jgi:hypothetical protein
MPIYIKITDVYFPVREGSLCGTLVKAIHPSKAHVRSKAAEKQGSICICEKFGGFWPIDSPELEYDSSHDSEETFDDEYPATSVIY